MIVGAMFSPKPGIERYDKSCRNLQLPFLVMCCSMGATSRPRPVTSDSHRLSHCMHHSPVVSVYMMPVSELGLLKKAGVVGQITN